MGGKVHTTKNVLKSLQPTQISRHASCLWMCMLWHVEFLNEQECVHKRLCSPLHLGTLHDVFIQMISLACRQPNYLSSSVSSEPKRTSTLAHTHGPKHIPQGSLSATPLQHCVMEAITLLLGAANVWFGLTCLALGLGVVFIILQTCPQKCVQFYVASMLTKQDKGMHQCFQPASYLLCILDS